MSPWASWQACRWRQADLAAARRLRQLCLILVWLLVWRLSTLMEFAPHASLWFPPAGLSFAALLMLGRRAVPALMVCAIVATFWVDRLYASHLPWQELLYAGVLFGLAHCASYGLGAWLLKSLIRTRETVSVPVVVPLFLIVGCLSALCATLLGVAALCTAGLLEGVVLQELWLPWWVGDMAGVLVLTPLFLALLSWRYPGVETWFGGLTFATATTSRRGFLGKLLISLTLLSLVMLLDAHFRSPEIAFGVFFLIIPQMWIVYTETPLRGATSIALFSTLTALWVAALGLIEQSLTYQFAICVIAASGYFGFAVPALLAQNRQLSELAFRDGLTGVVTRGHFFERAVRIHAEARRRGSPVSLIVFDLDHFKAINDTHGHDVGDKALIRLCQAVRAALGAKDLFGRFGGDEFLLLLPGHDGKAARHLADRLQQRLGEVHVPPLRHGLSATFGVVTLTDDETVAQAFSRADHRLLEAKRQRSAAAPSNAKRTADRG
ncbi:sensor domain-containing diguanylate cyclase [Modicisalibacter coralii]|uniref:sensor domain-containing diguanylate cyclase n=1 Tax=Modicisalibacter coralii TaxID=2304602 RepID=UPI00100A615E|nr:diguanylate cyclase [Halomonas coralii]